VTIHALPSEDAVEERCLRVIVVQGQTLFRHGMVNLLEEHGRFEVLADTGSPQHSVELVRDLEADLVIVDADLPATDAPTYIEVLSDVLGTARLLVVASHAGQAEIEAAMSTGRAGFTLKSSTADEFAGIARRVADGELYLHPEAAAALARGLAGGRNGRPAPLTARQREILRMVALGLENKQIARRLGIGVHTVKTHVSRIIRKLGVHTRTEAAVIATRRGLVDHVPVG